MSNQRSKVFGVIVLALFFQFPELTSKGIFRRYKIVHINIEVIRSRPEFYTKLWLQKFNRTTPVMNADMRVLDSKLCDFKVWIDGFERLGMEHIYTKSAISVSGTYREFLSGKFLVNGGWEKFTDFPTSCPLRKGNYTLRNWVVEEKHLPPYFPGNHWRVDVYLGPPTISKPYSNHTSKISYYFQVVYY